MKLRALNDKVIIDRIEKGERKTEAGIVLPDDDKKDHGIRPRWAHVHAVGKDVKGISPGQWVYVEHGRWTREMRVRNEDDQEVSYWGVPVDDIHLVSDEQPVEFADRFNA